jgi:hypothetical protein
MLLQQSNLNLQSVRDTYEEMAGTWTGCDWPTCFGAWGLNLNGCTSAQAVKKSAETVSPTESEVWRAAAQWLTDVEKKADEAAIQGALALASTNAGCDWEALEHARRAWVLEREAGRPSPRAEAPSWQQLYEAIRSVHGTSKADEPLFQLELAPPAMERQIAQLSQGLERLERRMEQFAEHAL